MARTATHAATVKQDRRRRLRRDCSVMGFVIGSFMGFVMV